ncbi:hypothetical protein C0993_007400 [Termitomyces sp. T159_Od127]|nr:hypothetical protein C0993_007400 [Termitomyces sp. T159_Od127]
MSKSQHLHYNEYSGFYRCIDDLSAHWFASPKVKTLAPLETALESTLQPAEIILADEPVPSSITDQPRSKGHTLAKLLRKLADKIGGIDLLLPGSTPQHLTLDNKMNVKLTVNETPIQSDKSETEVPSRDWKAWGYYACPRLHRDGGYVKNYPPLSHIPPNVNVEEVYRNLKDEKGIFHPERWIRGLQHPALPPRPERWKEHPKGVPLPFPWQCQLNPLLQHSTFDKPPLDWDIHHYPSSRCCLGRTGDSIIPISAPDRAQPATYPFVTHMYINSLADDPYPEHFWPFYVVNEHGVTVGDVLETIWKNFQEYISRSEFDSWANLLSRQQTASFSLRMRGSRVEARRIDILGTQCVFKGLEPHPNREGWSMFLGLG